MRDVELGGIPKNANAKFVSVDGWISGYEEIWCVGVTCDTPLKKSVYYGVGERTDEDSALKLAERLSSYFDVEIRHQDYTVK